MSKYAIGKVCPRCGQTAFKRVEPEGIAFTWDRICRTCLTRYTPPTPLWAAVVFVALGVALLIIGVWLASFPLTLKDPVTAYLRAFGPFCVMSIGTGTACLVYGIRCLKRRGSDRQPLPNEEHEGASRNYCA
jgi:hypothetical protein